MSHYFLKYNNTDLKERASSCLLTLRSLIKKNILNTSYYMTNTSINMMCLLYNKNILISTTKFIQ